MLSITVGCQNQVEGVQRDFLWSREDWKSGRKKTEERAAKTVCALVAFRWFKTLLGKSDVESGSSVATEFP